MKTLMTLALALFVVLSFSPYSAAEESKEKAKLDETKKEAAAEAKEEVKPGEDVGSVTKLSGKATLTRGDKTEDITINMKVKVGDLIKTEAKSSLVITLFNVPGEEKDTKNASELTVYENSTIKISERKKEVNGDTTTKIEMEGGKMESDVKDGRKAKWLERRDSSRSGTKPSTRGKSNYEVQTPTAVAGVRGTEFIVAVLPEKTFVYVKSGEVWVKDLVKGDIRTLSRHRLLEIGLDGFGAEVKTGKDEEYIMESPAFDKSFNPFSSATRDRIERDLTSNNPDAEKAVNDDISDKLNDAPSTADSAGTGSPVEPTSASDSIANEPTGPKNLPDPPPPPPAP
ncbi:MAG: hypothetical protein Kow00107_05990 [Planctomycetota bacterium]